MNKFRKSYGNSPRTNPGRPGEFRQEASKKFDAVCSKCGRPCQVPFRPNGVKPVYCNDCFGGPRQISPNREYSPVKPAGTKSIADLERQIGAMNTKIDTMLRILESMSPDGASAESEALPLPPRLDPKKRFFRKPGMAKK